MQHAIGDAAGKVVLEERPALADHVPVILPTNKIREAGVDRLIGNEVLQQECRWSGDQQYGTHADELRLAIPKQGCRRVARKQPDDAADEQRNSRIERSCDEASAEQSDNEESNLPDIVPIEAQEPVGGRGFRLARGGVE